MLRDHSSSSSTRKTADQLIKEEQEQEEEEEESTSQGAESIDKSPSTAELSDELERKLNEKAAVPKRANNIANNSGIIANDSTQCKIIAADKKMLFIISKDNFLFKRGCLTKAKQVITTNTCSSF